jgi:hypothetical protein
MKRLVLLLSTVLAASCCTLWAYTLTFDDIPQGQGLGYYTSQYGIGWYSGFHVVDQSQNSWSQAHSGTNVLIWNGPLSRATGWYFGGDLTTFPNYTVRSVGAYFSTDMGQVLTIFGVRLDGSSVSATIGATGESWHDRYVEVSSAAGDIVGVGIGGISSSDARYRFSMDDLTIEPVPEPSSLAALALATSGVGLGLFRRRRR